MKKTFLLLAVGIITVFLCSCENENTDLTAAQIETLQTEASAADLQNNEAAEPEKPAAIEFKSILDEIDENIEPDMDYDSPICVKTAVHLMNWGVGTTLTVEETKAVTVIWLSNKGNDEQAEFSNKLDCVYKTYRELLKPNAEELLKSAGCKDAAYPWSDSPLETVEAVAEAVGLK